MILLLVIYWIATTIYGAYWLVKNPSDRRYEDNEYVTLLEVIAKLFPAMLIAWLAVPMFLLHQIKFKR
jgi:heme/copper-type cytochrome/quinol oxidase subunit 2